MPHPMRALLGGRRTAGTAARERGASSLEYGLLIAGIVIVAIAVVLVVSGNLDAAFSDTGS